MNDREILAQQLAAYGLTAQPKPNTDVLAKVLFDPAYRPWVRGMGGAEAMPGALKPGGDYDYAAAVQNGVVPQTYEHDGQQHWPSVVEQPPRAEPEPLKAPGHPTGWMEGFMQATGVDPHAADEAAWAQAKAAGAGPRFDRPAAANRVMGKPGDWW